MERELAIAEANRLLLKAETPAQRRLALKSAEAALRGLSDRLASERLTLALALPRRGYPLQEVSSPRRDASPVMVKTGFDPDEPRVVAGQTGGGRWTTGGAGDAGGFADDAARSKGDTGAGVDGSVDARGSRDNTPVVWADDHGQVIRGIDGNPIVIPTWVDPHFFVDQGIDDRGAAIDDPSIALYDLWEFRQRGGWDLQRDKGVYLPQFRDAANVVIGLYAAALGLPPAAALHLADRYAEGHSRFVNEVMDRTYVHLPQRNVYDIKLGYELFQSGRVASDRE
jgi:hypothetical protein